MYLALYDLAFYNALKSGYEVNRKELKWMAFRDFFTLLLGEPFMCFKFWVMVYDATNLGFSTNERCVQFAPLNRAVAGTIRTIGKTSRVCK